MKEHDISNAGRCNFATLSSRSFGFVEEHDITKGGWPVASSTTLSTEPYSTVVEVLTLESAFKLTSV